MVIVAASEFESECSPDTKADDLKFVTVSASQGRNGRSAMAWVAGQTSLSYKKKTCELTCWGASGADLLGAQPVCYPENAGFMRGAQRAAAAPPSAVSRTRSATVPSCAFDGAFRAGRTTRPRALSAWLARRASAQSHSASHRPWEGTSTSRLVERVDAMTTRNLLPRRRPSSDHYCSLASKAPEPTFRLNVRDRSNSSKPSARAHLCDLKSPEHVG